LSAAPVVVVVAALSARVLAEAAAHAGHGVVALDCFGDLDTQRVSQQWLPIQDGESARIAPDRFLAALADVAQRSAVMGWIAGAGFEGQPELLAQGAALLPLIGMGAAEVRQLRDPRQFFATLDALHIAHPAVLFEAPKDPRGWLVKDAGGSGAWHIRAAGRMQHLPAGCYLQREAVGTPMSATLLGNGQEVFLLGINRQIIRSTLRHAFVFCGVVGPVAVAPAVTQRVQQIASSLAGPLHLRGLLSLDFLLDGEQLQVLEINPRPPASLSLYPGALAAHLQACMTAQLPSAWAADGVRGQRIVYAQQATHLSATMARRLAAWPHAHDLPNNGMWFDAGDPVCSVQAQADSAHAVSALLQQRHDALLAFLENPS
jgi:uncharacterized protein